MTVASWSSAMLSSESGLYLLPKFWRGDGKKPGIIFCHGANGDEFEANNHTGGAVTMRRLVERVVRAGFPVFAGDFGGNAWGNPAAVAKVETARGFLQGTLGAKAGKVAFIAQSMGHLTAMNWVAQNRALTSCVFGSMGVCDLNDIAANASYTASINAAYGGAYSNTTHGPTSNPTVNAATKYSGLRWLYSVGTSDTTCPPATSAAMATAIGSTATRRLVSGTHAWATVGGYDLDEIVAFFQTYNV